MPDIKTGAVAKKAVKAIDKSVIAAQRMKNAYVQAKEKAERTRSTAEESPEEYATDHVSDGTAVAAYESAQLFDRQGRKSVEVTKENISKAKEYLQRKRLTGQPKMQPPAQVDRVSAPVEQQRTNVKPVKQGRKPIKQSAKSTGKSAVKTAKGNVKAASKSVKTARATGKAAVKTSRQTAQVTVKTARSTVQATRVAAMAAAATVKKAAILMMSWKCPAPAPSGRMCWQSMPLRPPLTRMLPRKSPP